MKLEIHKTLVPFVVASIAALDQITKYFADRLISPYSPIGVLPFFNLVNIKNTGSAFGLFGGLGNVFFIGMSVFAIIFIIVLIVRGKDGFLALSLILSGALGNLADRVFLGHVRDFIDVYAGKYHWPAFNVADSALTAGVLLLIFEAFFGKPPSHLSE